MDSRARKLKDLDNAIQSDPSSAKDYIQRGDLYVEKNKERKDGDSDDLLDALSDYHHAQRFSEDPALREKAGKRIEETYRAMGPPDQATGAHLKEIMDTELWMTLEKISPTEKTEEKLETALLNLALACEKVKAHAKAYLYLKECIKKNPSNASLHFSCGESAKAKGFMSIAIPHFKKCISLAYRQGDEDMIKKATAAFQEALAHKKDGKKKEHKQAIFDEIKKIEPVGARILILKESLKKESPLGEILWTRRPGKLTDPSLGGGFLKEISEYLKKIETVAVVKQTVIGPGMIAHTLHGSKAGKAPPAPKGHTIGDDDLDVAPNLLRKNSK